MNPATRARIKAALARVGLAGAASWFLHEVVYVLRFAGAGALLRNARHGLMGGPDGLPMPPSRLVFLVSGSRDSRWFLERGRLARDDVRTALEKSQLKVESFERILDFGCGCGRVLRYWSGLKGTEVHGTDYNPLLVAWCQEKLSFARCQTNELAPPTRYADGTFDFAYAFSILTHLPEKLQLLWMEELHRVIRPGGYFLFTTHGDRFGLELPEPDRSAFAAGRLVVRREELAGSNGCAAYHPRAYVERQLSKGWSVAQFLPSGSQGTAGQDIYLFRRE